LYFFELKRKSSDSYRLCSRTEIEQQDAVTGRKAIGKRRLTLNMIEPSDRNTADEQEVALEWLPLDELQQAADTGDAKAITELADYYFWGPGEDAKKGVSWYKKAAKLGNAHAQFSLGFALFAGAGVTCDRKKAAKWFREAAEQGHPIAQMRLTSFYVSWTGRVKQSKESDKWAKKSAEQGWPVGQLSLGTSLWYGWGVAENKREACMWFIISDVPEESKKDNMDSCLSEFGTEELGRIKSDADEWLDAHPKARQHEYDCWISPKWLD
jgi:TPR repeat protein